jgi:parvulin-like peptidyl-prolyl isomerase
MLASNHHPTPEERRLSMDRSQVPIAHLNGKTLSLADLKHMLLLEGRLEPLLRELLVRHLLKDLAKQHGLTVSDAELQEVADRERLRLGLVGAKETMEFLSNRKWSVEDFEEILEGRLLSEQLKKKVVGEQVDAYYAEHPLEFQYVELSQIVVRDASMAEEIRMQAEESEASFEQLAREHSEDQTSRGAGGYLGRLIRPAVSPKIVDRVFGAQQGTVLGPLEVDGKFLLLRVDRLGSLPLDAMTREQIARTLFDRWINEQLQKATVTYDLAEA